MKSVADSLYLQANEDLFNDIGSLKLPLDFGKAFYKARNGRDWPSNSNWQTNA